MTKADVLERWKTKDQDLFLNELNLRGLSFDPEEAWVDGLGKATAVPLESMPKATAELRKRIPPAPELDVVNHEAPDLLAKLRKAAQDRSQAELEPLVHPDLLAEKARIYDLFDIASYRSHTIGAATAKDNREAGVPFFQLTTSQVERLHYVMFSISANHLVVRDIKTGPELAADYLHDEQQLALGKLDLVFRALNDGDDSGLKNLCTPGLYESLKALAGVKPEDKLGRGSRLMRGVYQSLAAISVKPSVSLDQKSIRVVVRVGYPMRNGKQLQYDVDFERVDNDLKVVRVRDIEGRVVAFDPNIDNYLNRRYGLPDGPPITADSVPMSDQVYFFTLDKVRGMLKRALETRNAQMLKDAADEFLDSEPNSGEGYGVRAAADEILGKFDDAAKDATRALELGGEAYFVVMRNFAFTVNQQFSPVVLGISKTKIEYLPVSGQGQQREDIPMSSISQVQFERVGTAISIVKGKPRPFLSLEFHQEGGKKDKKENYNLAAFYTSCPGEARTPGGPQLMAFSGGTVCGPSNLMGRGNVAPIMVPQTWEQDLKVVLDTIELARGGAGGKRR